MNTKFNIKSWKAWAMVICAGVFCCLVVAGTGDFLPPFPIDLDEHPIVENVMYLMGCALFTCAIVLSVVAGRKLSVTWARRLFWLNLISLILFALVIMVIWLYTIASMPYILRIIAVSLFQLLLFICFWSFFFGLGVISRQTLRRQGFHILSAAAPPILFFVWLWMKLPAGP